MFNESSIFGISVRAIACMVIIISFCSLAIALKDVTGLKELALIACGYLFGKQQSGGSNVQTPTTSNGDVVINQPDTGKS
jgi:hypothetical protein